MTADTSKGALVTGGGETASDAPLSGREGDPQERRDRARRTGSHCRFREELGRSMKKPPG
jgi:hypothetical protein